MKATNDEHQILEQKKNTEALTGAAAAGGAPGGLATIGLAAADAWGGDRIVGILLPCDFQSAKSLNKANEARLPHGTSSSGIGLLPLVEPSSASAESMDSSST